MRSRPRRRFSRATPTAAHRDRGPGRPRPRLSTQSTWRCPPPRSAAARAARPRLRTDGLGPRDRAGHALIVDAAVGFEPGDGLVDGFLALAAPGQTLADLRFRELAPREHFQGDQIRVVGHVSQSTTVAQARRVTCFSSRGRRQVTRLRVRGDEPLPVVSGMRTSGPYVAGSLPDRHPPESALWTCHCRHQATSVVTRGK